MTYLQIKMTDEKTYSSSAPTNITYQCNADRYSDTSSSVSSQWTGYSSIVHHRLNPHKVLSAHMIVAYIQVHSVPHKL